MESDKIDRHIKTATENFNEILESSVAVKGDTFGLAISLAFESAQVIEMMARMMSLVPSEEKDHALALVDSAQEILGSMVVKSCSGIEEAHFQEALDMASVLMRHREAAMESIRKEIEGEAD